MTLQAGTGPPPRGLRRWTQPASDARPTRSGPAGTACTGRSASPADSGDPDHGNNPPGTVGSDVLPFRWGFSPPVCSGAKRWRTLAPPSLELEDSSSSLLTALLRLVLLDGVP